jgi:hypothetical protein
MKPLVLLAGAAGLLAACPDVPREGRLVVDGQLDREGVEETNLATVDVAFDSDNARGEWWTCELRLTAESCVGDHHVNVWVAMPGTTTFGALGQPTCVSDGAAFGAFEQLTAELDAGDAVVVPDDVEVLVLVASDVDGDGAADLADDEETTAASRLVSGTVDIVSLGSFEDPVSLRIAGQTAGGVDVAIDVQGSTAPVPNPGPLDVARTCVAPE